MTLQLRPRLLVAEIIGMTLLGVSGCAGTYAGEGAKAGLVGGAVAGAVGSLFWGGNVAGNIAASAVTSAAAGAAIGATQKKPAPRAEEPVPSTEGGSGPKSHTDLVERDRALAEQIGPENFEAARLLARCDHHGAILQARQAFDLEQSPERRTYALLIEAVAAEEAGQADTAAAVYPRLVELDPSRESIEKARNDALSGILKVQKVRQEYGLRATCS